MSEILLIVMAAIGIGCTLLGALKLATTVIANAASRAASEARYQHEKYHLTNSETEQVRKLLASQKEAAK